MQKPRHVSAALALALLASTAAAAPQCYTSYGGTKPNKLYLYFPLADDPGFPEFGTAAGAPPTSPAKAFDLANIPNYTGNVADLRNAVTDVVADDYCEFNVEVIQTTSAPPATYPRRSIVSIGTDDGTSYGGLFGLTQVVNIGDSEQVDYAHEWAATYQGMYGGASGALNGANSTLERWADSIGGTAAHEGGHTYGLQHSDGLPVAPGEDALTRHLMASGDHYDGEQRAGYRRHFSDHEYAVLAANVGLSVQTIWNWDFVNPNAQSANKLVMDVLSSQASLTVSGPYNGAESPWVNPTVSGVLGTQALQGTTYNHFQVTWTTGHAWDGHVPTGPGPSSGVSGQVSGAASFHVGTGFAGVDYNQPNPILITNVTLYNGATALALHPRNVPFDAGTLDAADGAFSVNAFNVGGAPIQLASVEVQKLPRLLNIDAMVTGPRRLVDVRNAPFEAYGEAKTIKLGRTLARGQKLAIPVAKLSDPRQVIEKTTADDCERADRIKGRDFATCKPGISVSLFPATATLLSATVVDPKAKHWDPKTRRYIVGPVTSHAYLQIVGRHPDLNRNGVDDYIDILEGKARDGNRDGVPDDVQRLRDK